MATAAATKLRPVEISPTTLQYHVVKYKSPKIRPVYKKRFIPNEDAKYTLSQPWLEATDPMMPPYPYGKNHHFEEANHGLYGGGTIQSGNKISKGKNKGKTLRKWYPNIRVEKLKSNALNVELNLPVRARVMRTIRKSGGLDEYLLGEKSARIKELGMLGWKLRWMVLKSKAVQEKHELERQRLGLPASGSVTATFRDAWSDPEIRSNILAKMQVGWDQLKEKDQRFKTHINDTLRWKEAPDIKDMRSLRVFDPANLVLPTDIEEDKPKRLPQVRAGFGILQVMGKDGQWKGIEKATANEMKASAVVSAAASNIAKADVVDEERPAATATPAEAVVVETETVIVEETTEPPSQSTSSSPSKGTESGSDGKSMPKL